jgi:GNAT superfamily N-acetyltransferase
MAGLDRFVGTNVAHKAIVWGVYVSPAARGTGAAEVLFSAIFDHARSVGIELLELGVNEASAPARRFYARMGFEPFGLQPGSLKLGDLYFNDVLMMRRL